MRTAPKTEQKSGPGTPFHVLIAAAGSGERFGGNRPKQYALLNGKPLLRHTLDIFLNNANLASIRVIINPAHEALYQEAVKGLSLAAPIYGSNERKSSVYNALKEINNLKNEDIILVHDAVRPLVSGSDIQKLVERTAETGASSLATPVTDTLRKSSGEAVSRDGLWALQTPQAFRFGILKQAHEAANDLKATDDTSLVAALGHEIALVEGSRSNIKITHPEDMEIAARLLRKNYDVRTGFGYDVHAFDMQDKTRPLMLCGVKIEHPYGLAGHSDADVALHALTDAILGSIGEADIGHHFPPSDEKWKNVASDLFLIRARELACEKEAIIQNVDVTIICETPKIGPYREQMQKRIAYLLNLEPSQVGVKATTNEGLGFLGRGEGIAAQAVATLKIPGQQ
ncbi:MAG: bifunctional 2-C-methyl-D-erythritol 4-phosphate cytidylyltransferase/2-C-methyl-D-erythritol 2,4-cyclodiphosphate synthase [Alphaproteobacteria bacterium]|jgi:2-C-methyl-D-erythritol 4-phosphate cytidylyltransferase/2-C-methyl-D-erythritol 2,4-cyclodiphosphate synthase|nr:bifunctional 2-C-methyl-D-erythritol 4-phosphate cytidylyltransferase/2-C-methyl-D-erythritol 2,4-cyclodiphosphate synthase [Alphaproteobacteria bacterium]